MICIAVFYIPIVLPLENNAIKDFSRIGNWYFYLVSVTYGRTSCLHKLLWNDNSTCSGRLGFSFHKC